MSNNIFRNDEKKRGVYNQINKMILQFLLGFIYKVPGRKCSNHKNIGYFLAGNEFRNWFLNNNFNKLLLITHDCQQDIKYLMKYNINFLCRKYKTINSNYCCQFLGKLCRQERYGNLDYTFAIKNPGTQIQTIKIQDAVALAGKKELYNTSHSGLLCGHCRQVNASYWRCMICNIRKCKKPACQQRYPFINDVRFIKTALKFYKANFFKKKKQKKYLFQNQKPFRYLEFCNKCLKAYGQTGLEAFVKHQYDAECAVSMDTPKRMDLKIHLFKKD